MANDKLWGGRFCVQTDNLTDDFNSSVRFDKRLYKQDIKGSVAHVKMLAKQGIISNDDALKIKDGLEKILLEIESGEFEFDIALEDVHMNIENGDFLLVSQLLNAIGNILQFDEENQVCTAVVGSGFANMNPALVVAMMENQTLYLAAYAKEGLIKQHTAEKALKNIVDSLQMLE